jgi:hypothetical protein
MDQDLELKAMGTAYDSLKELDQAAQVRVLSWLKSKLSLAQGQVFSMEPEKKIAAPAKSEAGDLLSFDTVADAFAHAAPNTDVDKVLLVSSYLQEKSGGQELIGREINAELHNLGFRVGNITSTISCLINKKPQLMIQTRKEGKSQQAQKKYRVTVAGINAVKAMLASRGSNLEGQNNIN